MKIETKFDIGQPVYYIFESIREKDNIYYIERDIHFGIIEDIDISPYTIWYKINGKEMFERHVFATKEEAEQKLKELKNEENR